MRITIFNGEPDASAFHDYVHAVAGSLAASGNQVTTLDLRELDLKGCCGCFSCWVRTPGECARGDDSGQVCRAMLDTDLVVLASSVTMGFTTALLKRAVDQSIALLHPYFVMEGGEVHHRPRYASYPGFGLLLGPGPDTDAEDLEITTAIWKRTARNLKFRSVWTAVADRPAEEIAHALTAGH